MTSHDLPLTEVRAILQREREQLERSQYEKNHVCLFCADKRYPGSEPYCFVCGRPNHLGQR